MEKQQKSRVKNVFLDTQVYVSQNFQYDNAHFQKLTRLVHWHKVRLFCTDITRKEVISNIHESLDEAKKAIEQVKSKARILRNIKRKKYGVLFDNFRETQIQNELENQFQIFCEYNNIKILSCRETPIGNLMDLYFNKLPPFGPDKKKHEFPDAIVLETLKRWCEKENEEMFVVSADDGMVKGCEGTVNLKSVGKIEKLLEIIVLDSFPMPDSIRVRQDAESMLRWNQAKIEEMIIDQFSELGFWVDDVDGDVEEVNVEHVELIDHSLTDFDENSYTFDNTYEIDYNAFVSYTDPDSLVFDKETGDVIFKDNKELTVNGSHELKVRITFYFDSEVPETPTKIEVELDKKEDVIIKVVSGE